jgi:hypothetical protein
LTYQAKVPSTPAEIAAELAQVPTCRRILFETGRMAPMLYHGLTKLGLPIVCVESRQAYQALKSLATHKTDRNDARGLAHLTRTGFFKPVHVKSLPAHVVRSLIIARKKLPLENEIGAASPLRTRARSAGLRPKAGIRMNCLAASLARAGRGVVGQGGNHAHRDPVTVALSRRASTQTVARIVGRCSAARTGEIGANSTPSPVQARPGGRGGVA